MKKAIAWVISLFLLFLLAACSGDVQPPETTEFHVACFGCRQDFSAGEINVDFGLCQDCLMKVGAAYCLNCAAPGYTRDMVQGLCPSCSETAIPETTVLETTIPETTVPETTIPETTAPPEPVPCLLCGRSIPPEELRDGFCKSCYAQEQYDKNDELYTKAPEYYACSSCGRGYDTTANLYEGMCWACYNEDKDLCVSCKQRPSDGMGPSAMECAVCYDEYYDTCFWCGYDYWAEDMIDDCCPGCYPNAVFACLGCDDYFYARDLVDGYCFICRGEG